MAEETEIQEITEVSIDTLPLAEYRKARAEGKTTVEQKVAPVEETDEEEIEQPKEGKPKGKGGFQKRIDRLIKLNATLEEKLAAKETKTTEKTEEKATPVEGEPQEKDFNGDSRAYLKALTRFEVKMEIKEQQEAERREAEENRQKEIVKTYNQRVSAAQSRYDDWKEVVSQDIEIPQGVGLAILRMENGPDVAYMLGSDPDLRAELMDLDPLEAIGRAWEVSRELSGKSSRKSEEDEPEQEEKPAVKAVRKATPPIKPINGAVTQSTIPLDKMSLQDYKKARAAGRIH